MAAEPLKVEMSKIKLESSEGISGPEIVQFMQSIKEKGLLHYPTGYKKGDEIIVFAGRKRVEACRRLEMTHLFVNVFDGEPSQQEREEVHIHENLFRLNLPWYEQVELERQLHEMR